MISRILSREPVDFVTIEEAMEHSRITDNYDELVVQMHLDAAHDIIEQYLNRKLSKSIVIASCDEYRPTMTLPFPPILNIQSVTCENKNQETKTLEVDKHFKYDNVSQRIRFLNSWYDKSEYSHFIITFECGYSNLESIPKVIKHAILMTFATLYENREDNAVGVSVTQIPSPAKRLCKSYRVRPL